MDMISLQGKTNFFEKRVAEYQKAGVMNSDSESKKLVSTPIFKNIKNIKPKTFP
jgi:hypothetical protein